MPLDLPEPGYGFLHPRIWFDTQTATLPAKSFETLLRLHQTLKENPDVHIIIVGLSEGLPNRDEINHLTGLSRASKVMEIFINSGIDHRRIEAYAADEYEVYEPFRGDLLIIRKR